MGSSSGIPLSPSLLCSFPAPYPQSILGSRLGCGCIVGNLASSSLPASLPFQPVSQRTLVTRSPPSQNHTTIITVINHFSKEVHFGALPKLTSAKDTKDLLIQYDFHLHDISSDIVSDWGPSSSHSPSARPEGRLPAFHLASTPRLMARQSRPTKIWKTHYTVLLPITWPFTACTYLRSCTPTIISSALPQACPLSRPP